MRHAGDSEAITLAIRRILRAGPVSAVQQAVAAIDLDNATRTSLLADIEAVTGAADVLSAADAGRHMRWAVDVLREPSALESRLLPTFIIPIAVLDMLAALTPVLSSTDVRVVIDHLISLPAQEDQSIAHGYAAIVRSIASSAWSDADKAAIAERNSDNFELSEELEKVLAASDPDRRSSLEERIAKGQPAALEAFGDVRDLSPDTVSKLVTSLSASIEKEIAELRSGQSAVRTSSFGGTLVIINSWHPEQASWEPILRLLSTGGTYTRHLKEPLQNLRRLADTVPADVLDRLEPGLRRILARATQRYDALFGNPEVRGYAAAALEAVIPSSITDAELWDLMSGNAGQRVGSVLVVASRRRPDDLHVLAALGRDPDPWVRAVVANQLAEWIENDIAAESASALLQRILDSDGTLVAEMVAVRFDGSARTPAIDSVAAQLEGHASTYVRTQVTLYRSEEPEGETSAENQRPSENIDRPH